MLETRGVLQPGISDEIHKLLAYFVTELVTLHGCTGRLWWLRAWVGLTMILVVPLSCLPSSAWADRNLTESAT